MNDVNLELVGQLAALGEPVRLRMLHVLEREELSVGELCQVLQVPQSTASRHLKVLTEGGWLVKRTAGPSAYLRLMLDELTPDRRDLWVAVRGRCAEPVFAEDLQRLAGVLRERQTDSTSFFGRVAGRWDDVRTSLFGDRFTAAASLALVPSNWSVADLGCGTGNVSELLAPWSESVIAVDSSAAMLEAAERRLAGVDNVRFVRSDLAALDLDEASVDAAVCFLVLHHVDDPAGVVNEMARVLRSTRSGGIALVVDMVRHNQRELAREMGHKRLGFEEHEIEGYFRDAGLGEPRIRRLPMAPDAIGPGLFAAVGRIGQ